mmetsp:Transcript_8999/g.38122  ORF Transcript_8999/g.38122 Transcript_8999/m.38122 type:complete len:206 (+) Transcript_8999:1659-2276(+)
MFAESVGKRKKKQFVHFTGAANPPARRACSATFVSTTSVNIASVSVGDPLEAPYAAPETPATVLAISRPLKPSIFAAALSSAASSTSASTAMEAPVFPPPRLPPFPIPSAPRNPVAGASSPASSPRTTSLSKYSFNSFLRASRSGKPNSMLSSMRSSTAASRSSGRFVAMTKTTSLESSPVRYRSAFNAERVPPGWLVEETLELG